MTTTTTPKKDNSVISVKYDETRDALDFTVLGIAEVLTVPMRTISEANNRRFLRHGVKQRVSDAAAKPRGTDKNATKATPAEKHAAMKRVVEHIVSGSDDWSPAREGGGGIVLDAVILAAIGEVLGKDVDAVKAFIEAGAKKAGVSQRDYLARLATGKAVAPIVDRMRAERASDVDPDAELAAAMAADEEGEDEEEAPTE